MKSPYFKTRTKEYKKSEQADLMPAIIMQTLADEGREIFLFYFHRIFLDGFHLRLGSAVFRVENSRYKKKTKRRMLDFLRLCSVHRSIEIAVSVLKVQEDFTQQQINSLLKKFSEIGVHPLTIPLRWEMRMLPSVSELIQQECS